MIDLSITGPELLTEVGLLHMQLGKAQAFIAQLQEDNTQKDETIDALRSELVEEGFEPQDDATEDHSEPESTTKVA